jgi:hypothetical protein
MEDPNGPFDTFTDYAREERRKSKEQLQDLKGGLGDLYAIGDDGCALVCRYVLLPLAYAHYGLTEFNVFNAKCIDWCMKKLTD